MPYLELDPDELWSELPPLLLKASMVSCCSVVVFVLSNPGAVSIRCWARMSEFQLDILTKGNFKHSAVLGVVTRCSLSEGLLVSTHSN